MLIERVILSRKILNRWCGIMKVILLKDVKALGKKGMVVDVSDGYAKNFLLKGKLAVEANAQNMNVLKTQEGSKMFKRLVQAYTRAIKWQSRQ